MCVGDATTPNRVSPGSTAKPTRSDSVPCISSESVARDGSPLGAQQARADRAHHIDPISAADKNGKGRGLCMRSGFRPADGGSGVLPDPELSCKAVTGHP